MLQVTRPSLNFTSQDPVQVSYSGRVNIPDINIFEGTSNLQIVQSMSCERTDLRLSIVDFPCSDYHVMEKDLLHMNTNSKNSVMYGLKL